MKSKNESIISIKPGAIFLADAHENPIKRGFYELLCQLESSKLKAPQLFLLGDIFDILVYEVKATHAFALPYVELLEKLAQNMEIYYLEGNHDFSLAKFFTNVRVFSIEKQPVMCKYEKDANLKIALAHGDVRLPFFKNTFLLLRKKKVLKLLNFFDLLCGGGILKYIEKTQLEKDLFKKIQNFDEIAKKRVASFLDVDCLIEGHYHQNYVIENENLIKYFNLGSFAYKCTFFVVQSLPEIKFQEKILRSKNV